MEALEHFAKIMLVTLQLGRQQLLTEDNIRKLVEARSRYEGAKSLASMPPGPLAAKILAGLKVVGALMISAGMLTSDFGMIA
jgi:hypothetical protein